MYARTRNSTPNREHFQRRKYAEECTKPIHNAGITVHENCEKDTETKLKDILSNKTTTFMNIKKHSHTKTKTSLVNKNI
jgi:hypothetical protein